MIQNRNQSGITLAELLIVLVVVGILAGMFIPNWLRFLRRLEVLTARDNAYQVLLSAKQQARQTKLVTEVCFKQDGKRIVYSSHYRIPTRSCSNESWEELKGKNVEIDITNTTFFYVPSEMAYRIQFNHLGTTNGRLGRITFSDAKGENHYCTFVSTLLGAQRKTEGQRCTR
ncbi:pilus assembly FimT family protein [Laspinema olomoucense]|uniref:pilus assembly FimT family protein n=1 Tax=Laspinema olomoucense TaxID=3231600 RepID=UPI0021BB1B97|nr:type II secretion system protein [Laspinema sp. D3d]MCT7975189.1 type II secretion system GspH family protein [Laspinema sp. D3d]